MEEVQLLLWGYATEGFKGEEDQFVGEVDQNQKPEQVVWGGSEPWQLSFTHTGACPGLCRGPPTGLC